MSYYTEQDPLLPKDKGAPEIHGSRPQSIKNVGNDANEEAEVFEDDDDTPRRKILGDIMPLIFGLCLLFSLALIFLPEDIFGDQRPVPKTVEQRVNKILTDTPLIGILAPKICIS
jgi:membrane dipeptidase